MFKYLLVSCLIVSSPLISLSFSTPVDFSCLDDERIVHYRLAINEKGHAAIACLCRDQVSKEGCLKLVTKFDDARWSSVRPWSGRTPSWIEQMLLTEEGQITVGTEIKRDKDRFALLVETNQSDWSIKEIPLSKNRWEYNWCFTESEIFNVSLERGISNWVNSVVVVKGLVTNEKKVFSNEANAIPRFLMSGHDSCLLIWEGKQNQLYGSWLRDNEWSQTELIHNEHHMAIGPELAVSKNGSAVCCYELLKGVAAGYYKDNAWSWVQLSDEKHVSYPTCAVDSNGNSMVVWDHKHKVNGYQIVVAFKGHNQAEVVPLQLPMLSGKNTDPVVACDDDGNFLIAWKRTFNNSSTIWASVYSQESGGWSDPVQISPEGILCDNMKFKMNSSGKGIIAWQGLSSSFDVVFQVAEIETRN